MGASIRQWFEVPNSNSTRVSTLSGSFGDTTLKGGGVRGATLAGSAIVVVGTYSYDSTELGSCTDDLKQVYKQVNYIADTSSAAEGHQNFQLFLLANAKALSATDKITFTEPDVDYGGALVFEIESVTADPYVDSVANWQQTVSGSKPNNLTSRTMALPAGEYFILAHTTNCTDHGAAPPYAPAPGDRMQFVANWFTDIVQVKDYPIGTIAEYTLNATGPDNYQTYFTTPGSSQADNYVTVALALAVSSSVVTSTPFSGTLVMNGESTTFSGSVPAALPSTQANPFTGAVAFGNVSGTFGGTIPAKSNTPPVTPPPVTPPPVTPPPVTPPVTGMPTMVTPIFYNGVKYNTADWDSAGQEVNYDYAAAGIAGPGPVIDWPNFPGNPYWLPYLQNTPGGSNPASNGVGYPSNDATHFTFAVKPSQSGFDLAAGLYEAQGNTNDIGYGALMYASQHPEWLVKGPGIGTPNEWSLYSIPLTAYGPILAWYYKIILDKQGSTPVQDVLIDYVGFSK